RRPALARGRASAPPPARPPPSAGRACPGRGHGSARAGSGGGWERTARGRTAPRAPPAAPARRRTPCASCGREWPRRRPSACPHEAAHEGDGVEVLVVEVLEEDALDARALELSEPCLHLLDGAEDPGLAVLAQELVHVALAVHPLLDA